MLPTSSSAGGRFVRFVAFASLLGALANLGGLILLPGESQAVRTHAAGDLATVIAAGQEHVANRYGLYAELRSLTDGGRITIHGDVLNDFSLEHLALLTTLRHEDTRRVGEQALALADDSVVAEGVVEETLGSSAVRPYVIALRTPDPTELFVFVTRRSGTIIVVDSPLASEIRR